MREEGEKNVEEEGKKERKRKEEETRRGGGGRWEGRQAGTGGGCPLSRGSALSCSFSVYQGKVEPWGSSGLQVLRMHS